MGPKNLDNQKNSTLAENKEERKRDEERRAPDKEKCPRGIGVAKAESGPVTPGTPRAKEEDPQSCVQCASQLPQDCRIYPSPKPLVISPQNRRPGRTQCCSTARPE